MNVKSRTYNAKKAFDPKVAIIKQCYRVDNWLLMSSPWPTAAMCLLYYYIIRVAGPRFIKNREPYNIQKIVIVYNLLQTLLSLWIWLRTASFWLTGRYNWLCQPVDYSGAPSAFYSNE